MKKVLTLALVFLLALSMLTACGGGTSAPPSSDNGGGTKSNSNISDADKELAKDAIDAAGIGSEKLGEQAKEFLDGLSGDWPFDLLPSGMPVYPDGKVQLSMNVGNAVTIIIEDTNEDSFIEYVEMLKNDGWTFSSDSTADKEEWSTRLVRDKSEVRMAVQQK